MKIITSMLALLLISGCGFDLTETAKDEAMLRELSSAIDLDLERLDGDDIEIVRDGRLIIVLPPVLRPEFTRKIIICHKGKKTMSIEYRSWLDHRRHGDTRGACNQADCEIR